MDNFGGKYLGQKIFDSCTKSGKKYRFSSLSIDQIVCLKWENSDDFDLWQVAKRIGQNLRLYGYQYQYFMIQMNSRPHAHLLGFESFSAYSNYSRLESNDTEDRAQQTPYICNRINHIITSVFHTQCSILSLPSDFLSFAACESGAGLRLSGLRMPGLRLTGLRRPSAGERRGNLISFNKIGRWILFGWEIAFRSCSFAAFALWVKLELSKQTE